MDTKVRLYRSINLWIEQYENELSRRKYDLKGCRDEREIDRLVNDIIAINDKIREYKEQIKWLDTH